MRDQETRSGRLWCGGNDAKQTYQFIGAPFSLHDGRDQSPIHYPGFRQKTPSKHPTPSPPPRRLPFVVDRRPFPSRMRGQCRHILWATRHHANVDHKTPMGKVPWASISPYIPLTLARRARPAAMLTAELTAEPPYFLEMG